MSDKLKALLLAGGIIYAVFLPFIFHSGDILYPVKFYFDMAGSNYNDPAIMEVDTATDTGNFLIVPEIPMPLILPDASGVIGFISCHAYLFIMAEIALAAVYLIKTKDFLMSSVLFLTLFFILI